MSELASVGAAIGWSAGLGAASLSALGVFHPRVPLFGPLIWRGSPGTSAVALTFDDGPHPDFTPRIAEALERRGARGTFFCVGERAERHPQLIRALARAGHQLENHTYRHNVTTHLFSARRLREDLGRCQAVLTELGGSAPTFYRPAVGVRNPAVHAAARALGLTVVTWTAAARDGLFALGSSRAARLASRCPRGAILALHDGMLGERQRLREQTVSSLDVLLSTFSQRGLALVTLTELLQPRKPLP